MGMTVLCDFCRNNNASIQVTHSVDGVLQETHLCTDCTRRAGLSGGRGAIGKLVGIRGELKPRPRPRTAEDDLEACPGCGLDFEKFKKSVRLGCPQCYEFFADRLRPVIMKCQGSLVHKGKTPPGLNGGAGGPGS